MPNEFHVAHVDVSVYLGRNGTSEMHMADRLTSRSDPYLLHAYECRSIVTLFYSFMFPSMHADVFRLILILNFEINSETDNILSIFLTPT